MKNISYTVNNERILFTQLDEEGIIYDVESNEYLNLNPTFCSIFLLIQEGLPLLAIKAKLLEEYDVDEQVCIDQLLASVKILEEKGFIKENEVDEA
ncbi:PqqD family protein [Mongoliitalea lutea]|uniref:Coenzyme PQQ synthesis protein D (PqqD) n=1 Tax=Mongoliitalea lutea TaxID=849756 RepID=A0A8J3CY33_9BACT|nr:PqqD family protein [Mongoliitalea lutea]GHB36990.1 hypothetical protein GCM10008106_17840 [Mongoliitalea lutea]